MTDPATMGAYLRAARLARRVSVERAAEETRIRPDFLKRMESDEFDFLAPAYVRGFLRSYAKYLQIDPEPLTAEFDTRFGGGRVDTAQIAALERHGKKQSVPRKGLSSWSVAALIAGVALVGLAAIGIAQPEDEPREPLVAEASPSPGPSPEPSLPEPSLSPSVSPSVKATPTDDGSISFEDGIRVVIRASEAACWVHVEEDGLVAVEGTTIAVGQQLSFKADRRIEMRLGFPAGVELIVNGRNLGSPGGENAIDFVLPDDVDRLL